METRLISFISNIQLTLDGTKHKSDQILRILGLYAEEKIPRELCIRLVFTLLKSNPELQQEFAEIIEERPPAPSRSGCIIDDPFINTVIEFELWPGCIDMFLHRIRDVMSGTITIIDAFVDLEYVKPTSGPFWLLWDLFKPISKTNHFIQLIYDGCVGTEHVPIHLKTDHLPSEIDDDPARITHMAVIDSDIVCSYRKDIRGYVRNLGLKKIGSYGLLSRGVVDIQCSGRGVKEFATFNDRWTIGAAGLDVIFCASKKNQYEERLFINEDERVEVDVRISRMRSLIHRIDLFLAYIDNPNEENARLAHVSKGFPRTSLTDLDICTLREIYTDQYLEDILYMIQKCPKDALLNAKERVSQKYSSLINYRQSKEAEYYDLNKKNSRRSLDVRHETNNFNSDEALQKLYNYKTEVFTLNHEVTKAVADIINKAARNMNISRANSELVEVVTRFFLNILEVEPPPALSRDVFFHAYPSTTVKEDFSRRDYYITPELFRLFGVFNNLVKSLESMWESRPKPEVSEVDSETARGVQIALILGHLPASALTPSAARETLAECLPQFLATGKATPALESLFEVPSGAPLNSLDAVRKAVSFLVKQAPAAASDPHSSAVIEAVSVPGNAVYRAVCLEQLSSSLHIVASAECGPRSTKLTARASVPRGLLMKRSVRIVSDAEGGLRFLQDSRLAELQARSLAARKARKDGLPPSRRVSNGLAFRLGPCGVEFKTSGADLMGLRKE